MPLQDRLKGLNIIMHQPNLLRRRKHVPFSKILSKNLIISFLKIKINFDELIADIVK